MDGFDRIGSVAAAGPLDAGAGGSAAAAPGTAILGAARRTGHVEHVSADRVTGWAWDPSDPFAAVELDVFLGDQRVARLTADRARRDVRDAGHGTGDYGFSLSGLSGLLSESRERLSVRFADGGCDLHGSPRWVERPDAGLDDRAVDFVRNAVEAAVRAARSPEDLAGPLELLGRLFAGVVDARIALGADGSPKDGPRARLDDLASCEADAGPFADLVRAARAQYAPIELPPVPETPRVSVVICAHNQFEHTRRCLLSISEQGARAGFEVVLVDDASTDATLLAEFVVTGGVRVLRNPRNLGFLRSANLGARAARGEFLLFLNNDTEVGEGWLDELVRTFELMPEVGVAGSKLVYPDGRLQEAGGIVRRLGDAANWGNGRDPDEPRFCYLRDADYVSGAALMVPRALFEELGGFDEEFAPAYYEDTDLCFRARRAGRRVVVQPLSRVVHHEGASCGRDPASWGHKRFQAVNQRKFLRRWEGVLARLAPAGHDPRLEAERAVTRRAVFIDETVPTPDRDAGSNAAFEHIRLLQASGHKVTFLPAGNMARIEPYTADLQRLGVECLHAPHVRSVEEAFRDMAVAPDVVYLHRHGNAAKYAGLVREHFPLARLVYSVADLHFLRLRRQAGIEGDADLEARAARLERSELGAALEADAVIVHSHVEAELLSRAAPGAAVHVVPWTVRTRPAAAPASARSGVAFIGGYAHPPNVDAARHLLRAVLPRAREAMPGLRALLVGDGLPRDVAALAGPGAEVLGHVPDLGEVFDRVRCTVAPLRYGAGIKGKVLTSMAHGVPCVMSPVAAEGIALPEPLGWLIAGSDAEAAAKIVALHRDDPLAERLGEACLAFVREEFGAESVGRKLAAAVTGCPEEGRSAPR
ncbi:hypothetical protein GCM10009416_29230 [Craurococcus roseus]|uniref:Glycosyltransferase 2-like domain-containing protein n=1 Tax=Craurococcus roseus TaxID=77585 RepID=A0ABN1FE10_9PROT